MKNYLIVRISNALIVIVGVVSLVFFLIHFIPGDPVEVMLGESAQVSDREELRHNLGLDKPLLTQWQNYLLNVAQLDLGKSLHSRQPITEILIERLPATFELALVALLFALLISLPLGIIAATRKASMWDRSAMVVSLLGVSIPNFLMGPLLILFFSIMIGWFPVSGREGAGSIVLPALTLGTAMAAILSRMIRATLLDVINEDYIRTARAKGMAYTWVIFFHALPNTFLPLITLLGMQLGALLAGAVITEIVFSWPGIGLLTIEAINKRDYPLVQSCILLISISYVVVNFATDVLYSVLDPRVRLQKETA